MGGLWRLGSVSVEAVVWRNILPWKRAEIRGEQRKDRELETCSRE